MMKKCYSLLPVGQNTGFRMDGYYVWCGSVIRENGMYYLFAARWPEEKSFPHGYLTDSEIVLAVTDDLAKPFRFQKVIISKRDGGYWDSVMAHNPFIFKDGDTYVLFYIGSPDGGTKHRAIGYAYSHSLTDGWVRADHPLALPPDANNPAVIRTDEGKYLLYFRNGTLNVSVAAADTFAGPYTVVNDCLFPGGPIEDMFVYRAPTGGYVMVAEDAGGAYTGLEKAGVRFTSRDGIHWDNEHAMPAYDFDVEYANGTREILQRRERPFLLQDGERSYLFTTAKVGGEERLTGGHTWNMVQEIQKEL